jgi:hypothetical protein
MGLLTMWAQQEDAMKPKQSDTFRENAQNCADKAENTKDEPSYKRFKRMEAAWLVLAEEQGWMGRYPRWPIAPVGRSSLSCVFSLGVSDNVVERL